MNLLHLAPKLTIQDYRLLWSAWNHYLHYSIDPNIPDPWNHYFHFSHSPDPNCPAPSIQRMLFLDKDKVIKGLKIRMKRLPQNQPCEISLLKKLEDKENEPVKAGTKAD